MSITADDLTLHQKWLNGDADGVRLVRSHANLSWADLIGADLSRADLSGADLSRADLSWAYLSGAKLRGADLIGADLSRADLSGACLIGADLSRANLSWADLIGADLSRADLSGADLSRADLIGAIGLNVASDAVERLQNVAVAALADALSLKMDTWHSCNTSHCIAGWAIHQAGEPGRLLEERMGSEVAGLMLLGVEAHSHFFDSNEKARAYLQSVISAS